MKNEDLPEHFETSMSIRTRRIDCIFGYSTLFGSTKIVWSFGNSIKVYQCENYVIIGMSEGICQDDCCVVLDRVPLYFSLH